MKNDDPQPDPKIVKESREAYERGEYITTNELLEEILLRKPPIAEEVCETIEKDNITIMNAMQELQIYADYVYAELSEYWNLLIRLAESPIDEADIKDTVIEAVKRQLKWVNAHTEWIEEEVTTTKTIKRLKWHGE